MKLLYGVILFVRTVLFRIVMSKKKIDTIYTLRTVHFGAPSFKVRALCLCTPPPNFIICKTFTFELLSNYTDMLRSLHNVYRAL